MRTGRRALSVAGAAALVAGCAAGPALETTAGGLGIQTIPTTAARPALQVGTPEYQYFLEHDNDPAQVLVHFAKRDRKVQALAGQYYEVRATFTEAVVRSAANLADYHIGLRALPNSLTGFSLNVPSAGSTAGDGAPRLRYAQHTLTDDPLFPALADHSKTINPTTDSNIYFLGQGILKTAQANGFPPQVADVFDGGVSSVAVGSVNDVQSIKLSVSAAESLFNKVFMNSVFYATSSATPDIPLGPVVQDRALTDNSNLVMHRYYKWKFPFTATKFTLGSNLPLGRLIMDIRVVDANGNITDSGSSQTLLQNGANDMTVTIAADKQGLSSSIDILMPK